MKAYTLQWRLMKAAEKLHKAKANLAVAQLMFDRVLSEASREVRKS